MSKSTTTTPRITKQLTLEQVATLSGDPSKGVSLCIPRVFANISWFRIKEVFIALNWGYVDRVDVIPSGGTKRAFVHFAPGRFTATKVLDALCCGKQVKIVYDDPWFWKISLSRSEKPEQAPERPKRPKVEIDTTSKKPSKAGRRKLTLDLSDESLSTTDRKPGDDPILARAELNRAVRGLS